jgi:RHS repeat-associated protein
VVSSSGTLTVTTSYDAWGNPETAGGLSASTPFGYAGGYTDSDGLVYLINRYYDPQAGQFISVDPALSQTLQPYSYASGNPVSSNDPTGLWSCQWAPRWRSTRVCWKYLSEHTVKLIEYGLGYTAILVLLCGGLYQACTLIGSILGTLALDVIYHDNGNGEWLSVAEWRPTFEYISGFTWWGWPIWSWWDGYWIPYWAWVGSA